MGCFQSVKMPNFFTIGLLFFELSCLQINKQTDWGEYITLLKKRGYYEKNVFTALQRLGMHCKNNGNDFPQFTNSIFFYHRRVFFGNWTLIASSLCHCYSNERRISGFAFRSNHFLSSRNKLLAPTYAFVRLECWVNEEGFDQPIID